MEIIYTLENIDNIANQLIDRVSTKTLLLYGDMGVGKTTLIKALVKAIGSKDDVSSPTFSIVNEYKAKGHLIFHFDLYRVKNIEEAYNFGIEDYLFSDNWSIIEWPEVVLDILPEHYDRIYLTLNPDSSRTLKLEIEKKNMQSFTG